jgi:hypothetical protein
MSTDVSYDRNRSRQYFLSLESRVGCELVTILDENSAQWRLARVRQILIFSKRALSTIGKRPQVRSKASELVDR